MQKYYELAIGSPSNRGIICTEDKMQTHINHAKRMSISIYKSYYYYDSDILEHFKLYKSVRSYKGKVYLDNILFDIDKANLKDEYLYLALKEFIKTLKEDWDLDDNNIRIYFSGTGFHLEIPNIFDFKPSINLSQEVKETLLHYFPQADNIYDKARIIRINNTINNKSNLYKIPISIKEIYNHTIKEIKNKARLPRNNFKIDSFKNFKTFSNLIKKPIVDQKNNSPSETTAIVTCMQRLYLRKSIVGRRHQDMLRLASTFFRNGIPAIGIEVLLQYWAKELSHEEIRKIVLWVITNNARYSCSDKVLQEYCSNKCMFYKQKDYSLKFFTNNELEAEYIKFLKKDFSKISFNLANIYSMEDFMVYPGELVIVIGDTKIGKSAWVQNLVVNLQMSTLYLNLEMSQKLTYRRFIQIAHGMTKDEITKYYLEAKQGLSEAINHIKVLSISPRLNALKKIIAESGAKIVVVDVIDAIIVDGHDDDSKLGIIGTELKTLANDLDIIIIGIHHISKAASYSDLGVHSSKGSSSIEQKADKIIAIEGNQKSATKRISSLGARDEKPFKILAEMNAENFRFKQIV